MVSRRFRNGRAEVLEESSLDVRSGFTTFTVPRFCLSYVNFPQAIRIDSSISLVQGFALLRFFKDGQCSHRLMLGEGLLNLCGWW